MLQPVDDPRLVLTLSCPDRVGVVAGVAAFIAERGGWILEAAHHADGETGVFHMRQEVRASSLMFGVDRFRDEFRPLAERFGMTWHVHDTARPLRAVFFCSKQDHCIVDLLHRWRTGELACDLRAVISNHDDLRSFVEWHGVAYHHVPIPPGPPESKAEAFAEMAGLCEELGAETLVLARYMQVLPEALCRAYPNRILNIHHSFLPSFVGGRPYHQAYERGVKLIGATCHYVTAELDAGPIIEQDVTRVNHADTVADMIRRGRDVERRVLARGVALHLEHRVLVQGNKTVVLG